MQSAPGTIAGFGAISPQSAGLCCTLLRTPTGFRQHFRHAGNAAASPLFRTGFQVAGIKAAFRVDLATRYSLASVYLITWYTLYAPTTLRHLIFWGWACILNLFTDFFKSHFRNASIKKSFSEYIEIHVFFWNMERSAFWNSEGCNK